LTFHGVESPRAVPPEHVLAFDEAQRAWHAGKLAKRHETLTLSEPSLVLDVMSRKPKWCAVIALVGGGQEIHDGEAGLEEWGRALAQSSVDWNVVVSPDVLFGGESTAGHKLFTAEPPPKVRVRTEPAMHLQVSVRSPRAQRLSEWVNAVLRADVSGARSAIDSTAGFRILVTRDLADARRELRRLSQDSSRSGLLASSGAQRLRAEGLELDSDFHRQYPIDRWFLDGRDDFRSSHSLEVAMTEFECQGLELDYVGLCWGDDLTVRGEPLAWHARRLLGRRWAIVRNETKIAYLKNKYRVLLTRAREGLVIWVPRGDAADPTRLPAPLDATASFLLACGAEPLERESHG
jgi:hypothetical protein